MTQDLDHIFKYHSPRPDQLPKYEEIRNSGKYFAQIIQRNTPPGPDQDSAIRKIREAVMIANASVALDGILTML